MSARTDSNLTELGVPCVTAVPYGVHMCQFYSNRAELVASLVPYFNAGLRSNERCLWITAEPLDAAQALAALRMAGIDCEREVRRGALVVRDFAQWYGASGAPDKDEMVEAWMAEEERALSQGYAGLRITGNPSFVTEQTWDAFMEYEAHFHRRCQGRRIITLCTYPARRADPAAVLDVVQRHTCTLDCADDGWRILLPDGAVS